MRLTFTHPCPVDGCTTYLDGEVEVTLGPTGLPNDEGNVPVEMKPTFPVTWSVEAQRHTSGHLVQVVPETSSDERMHVLDHTCWCEPTLARGDRLVHA